MAFIIPLIRFKIIVIAQSKGNKMQKVQKAECRVVYIQYILHIVIKYQTK